MESNKAKEKKDEEEEVAALLIIDVQNDFCIGSMEIGDALKIIPTINNLRKNKKFKHIVRTRDWHPKGHVSF